MGTFRLLVRHEWALLRADAVIRVALVVFLVGMSGAIALGLSRMKRESADFHDLSQRALTQREALAREAVVGSDEGGEGALPWGARHPDFVANERGTYAVLPPAPLQGLTFGQSDLYPTHYTVTARLRDAQLSGDQLAHPLAQLTGSFDLTFVALYLYPLLILAVSADLTATDRQSGALRLLLAFPVRLSEVVAAKLAVRIAILLVLPVAVLVTAPAIVGWGDFANARIVLWAVAVAAYGGFWLALSLLIGARARSAAAAAITLAGWWLVLVVLIPSLFNFIVRTAYPVPSRVEFATRARAATREAIAEGSRQLGSFLEDHPASGTGRAGMQQYALLQETRDTEVARRMAPLVAQHEMQLSSQRTAANRWQLLSPIIMLQLALTDIAGTGDARRAQFTEVVTAFQASWQAHFQPRIRSMTALTPADISAAPVFTFHEEPAAVVARRAVIPLLTLAAMAVLLGWAGWRAYRHYDVTGTTT